MGARWIDPLPPVETQEPERIDTSEWNSFRPDGPAWRVVIPAGIVLLAVLFLAGVGLFDVVHGPVFR